MRTWILSVLVLTSFLFITYWFIQDLLPLLGPFVVALVIAELIGPVVDRLERLRIPRGLGVLLVLVLMLGSVGLLVTLAIAKVVAELQTLIQQLPYYIPLALDFGQHLVGRVGSLTGSLPAALQTSVQQSLQRATGELSSILPQMTQVLTAFSGLPALITDLLIGAVATFFITRDKRQIGAFLVGLLPPPWRNGARQVRRDVLQSAMGFAKAEATLILLTMALSTLGLAIIGSNYALLVGVLIGLCDILPVLGPAAIFVPWMAYQFTVGDSSFGWKLLILYAVTGAIRQVLEAKVVGDKIGLHPLATLFSVYVGFEFFGTLGFIIGPLLAIVLKAMIRSGLLPTFPPESP